MTTAAAATPTTEPARVTYTGHVALSNIDVVSNVRKKFDEKAIAELAANIKQLGRVISPITLRPGKKAGRYDLVAGERRTRAARLAGLTKICAQVLDLDDQQALEYQAAENIHRKDLTPIEEARAFKSLLDAKKYTVEQLAQLVDKSLPYVYRAVHLLELPENVIDAIEAGKLTPAHGHQILRVPEHDRGDICAYALHPDDGDSSLPTAIELKDRIELEMGSDLDHARFPKNKPYAGAMACTACPYNSGNQGKLFDGAEKGTCSNAPCYDTKTKQHFEDRIAAVKADYPDAAAIVVTEYAPFAGQSVKGGYVVTGPLEKKLGKGYAVVLAKNDEKLWQAKVEPKPTPGEGDAGYQPPAAPSPRDGYIRAASDRAILRAVGDKCKVLTREVAVAIIHRQGNIGDEVYAVLGLDPAKCDTNKLTTAQANQLAALSILAEPWGIEETCRVLKVDLKKIVAATKKAAGAEYDVKNAVHMAIEGSLGRKSVCGMKDMNYAPDAQCGSDGAATANWRDTTCKACLKKKPK